MPVHTPHQQRKSLLCCVCCCCCSACGLCFAGDLRVVLRVRCFVRGFVCVGILHFLLFPCDTLRLILSRTRILLTHMEIDAVDPLLLIRLYCHSLRTARTFHFGVLTTLTTACPPAPPLKRVWDFFRHHGEKDAAAERCKSTETRIVSIHLSLPQQNCQIFWWHSILTELLSLIVLSQNEDTLETRPLVGVDILQLVRFNDCIQSLVHSQK
jgi:hypothetical protein